MYMFVQVPDLLRIGHLRDMRDTVLFFLRLTKILVRLYAHVLVVCLLVLTRKAMPPQDRLHNVSLTFFPRYELIRASSLRHEALFDECLFHRNAAPQTTLPGSCVIRNEVQMQMRRRLVQMHHRIEQIQIRVSLPKTADVLIEHLFGHLTALAPTGGSLAVSELDDDLVDASSRSPSRIWS